MTASFFVQLCDEIDKGFCSSAIHFTSGWLMLK
jgi:hypothetical protein